MINIEWPEVPQAPTQYPVGVVVQTEIPNWYFIRSAGKLKIASVRALDSWNFGHFVFSSEIALSKTPTIGILGFREGTLIKSVTDAKLYLISENKRRQIIDPDILDLLFLSVEDAILVSEKEINLHSEGLPIT
jgi:hypothetical protein